MLPAIFTTVLWSFSVIAASKSGKLVGASAANLVRLIIALILLAIWSRVWGAGLAGDGFKWLLISGCVGFGIGDIAAYEAFPKLGPRLTALVSLCLAAPIAALVEWLWLGTQLTGTQMLAGGVVL